MDEDTVSTNTSADDKTEDFCDNPTQDTIAEGLLGLIKPTVDLLDEKFRATRASQLELRLQIEALTSQLDKISAEQQTAVPLDSYTRKLVDAQQKISIVGNILQTTQVAMHKKFFMGS
ncbi:SNAPIN protein homolog [Diaphorina citri]|uniref:Biogenesis of lysosome-related organelles complex 1 subunit 7 n=1 Tax=Diaphorina citri TaxID=121845 RepID=A0A1S3D2J9_DIACI|nr:SNAPIN protein homolog [Diaphorina citri]